MKDLGQVVPKNWNKLFNLKTGDVFFRDTDNLSPEEAAELGIVAEKYGTIKLEDLFMTFTAYPAPEIEYSNRFQTGKGQLPYNFKTNEVRGKFSFLHPSAEINERISHAFNNDSSTYSNAMARIADKANSFISAWTQLLTGSTQQSVYDVPVLWANSERREFTIVLSLFAYDDLENDVYGPINFFRLNSYPKLLKSDEEGKEGNKIDIKSFLGIIEQPSVFKITGGAFKTFYSSNTASEGDIGFYNLVNMTVNYNDPGKLYSNGYPMFAKLNLTFQEVIKTYRNFLEKKPVSININIKSNEIIQPTKGKTTARTFEQPSNVFERFVKATGVARLARNLEERVKNEIIGFALKTIQGSSLYKRFDDLLNIDLQHRIELSKYTKNGFSRSNTIEQSHINEVNNIKNEKAPKRNIEKIEEQHNNDIIQALKKVR